MLATFAIEICLLIATFLRYKLNHIAKLCIAVFFFLALFQLSEYFVCGGAGVTAANWSRIGFVAITTLPALGIGILHELAGKKDKLLVHLSYGSALAWMILFGFSERAFAGSQCTGNYVIFQLKHTLGGIYFSYYYGLLFLGIALGLYWALQVKASKKRQTLLAMVAGYLVFLVPTTIANTVSPATKAGIPSVMCGFAILFALILFGLVLPKSSARLKSK